MEGFGQTETNNQMDDPKLTEDPDLPEVINLSLHNPLIIQNVLSYVPRSEWPTTRLVCTTWEELSRPKWRNHAVLYINGVTEVNTQTTNENGNTVDAPVPLKCVTMKQFLEYTLDANNSTSNDPMDLTKHPFQNVKICSKVQLGSLDEIETKFWNLVGPGIKCLTLEDISVAPGGSPQLHRILGELTPNLEHFVYIQCIFRTYHPPIAGNRIPPGCHPKLTSITIKLKDTVNVKDKCEFCVPSDSFQAIIPDNCFHLRPAMQDRLSRLFGRGPPSIWFPLDWEVIFGTCPNLQEISNCYSKLIQRLHWKRLSDQIQQIKAIRENDKSALNIQSWEGILFGGDLMNQFCALSLPLRSFKGNIVTRDQVDGHDFLTAHQNTLKELTIEGHFDASGLSKPTWLPEGLTYLRMDRAFGYKLDFVAHTPNLQTLILNTKYGDCETQPIFTQRLKPLEHMKEFSSDFNLDEATFDAIVGLMPNLRKLRIGMDDKRWMIASLAWRDLKHLEWYQNDQLVLNEKAFVKFADAFTNLKTVVVKCKESCTNFGDVSIYNGFLRMPALQNLTVTFSPEVSPEAIWVLKSKITYVDC